MKERLNVRPCLGLRVQKIQPCKMTQVINNSQEVTGTIIGFYREWSPKISVSNQTRTEKLKYYLRKAVNVAELKDKVYKEYSNYKKNEEEYDVASSF